MLQTIYNCMLIKAIKAYQFKVGHEDLNAPAKPKKKPLSLLYIYIYMYI